MVQELYEQIAGKNLKQENPSLKYKILNKISDNFYRAFDKSVEDNKFMIKRIDATTLTNHSLLKFKN